MRGDNDRLGYYMPLLRRILIVLTVLAAAPVILWTITVFVRSHVGPPKLPTFRQLATTSAVPVPQNSGASVDATGQALPTPDQARVSAPPPASTTPTDAADAAAAPKGPRLADRGLNGSANGPTGTLKIAAAPPTVNGDAKATETQAAATPAPSDEAAANTDALVQQQPVAASEPPADLTPAAPLSGPIPLPPRRPRLLVMAQMTPSGVPMPRPRPDAAGPAGSATAMRAFDWLQNMFRRNSE